MLISLIEVCLYTLSYKPVQQGASVCANAIKSLSF